MLKTDREQLLKETYRYLGYRGKSPDEETAHMIGECLDQVLKAAVFACASKRVEAAFDGPETVVLGHIRVQSRTFARHMRGCHHAVIFAATIGIGVDRLIKRAQLSGMARAAMLQAAGAAVVESCCDEIETRVSNEEQDKGYTTRTRYSPGYGDFELKHQQEILSLLNASKEAGITLTDGYLMIPSKSVTAVIGVADHNLRG